jgi:predicted nucleotidyltransferase
VARGDARDASDVDLPVNTGPDYSLIDLGGFLEELKELLGCPVDLVTEDGSSAAVMRGLRQGLHDIIDAIAHIESERG